MKAISKEAAEGIIVARYKKLYEALLDTVAAINAAEPGGVTVDNLTIKPLANGKTRLIYGLTPIQLVIDTPERQFILRVVERKDKGNPEK